MEQTDALQTWLTQDIEGGASWSVSLSRAYFAVTEDRLSCAPAPGVIANPTSAGPLATSGPGLDCNGGGKGCLAVRLTAVATRAEDRLSSGTWSRFVDISVEAILDDHRPHNHPPASTLLTATHSFRPGQEAYTFTFPSAGLFYPDRTTHEFDVRFVFTIDGAGQPDGSEPLGLGRIVDGKQRTGNGKRGRPLSSVSIDTVTSVATTRPVDVRSDASPHVELPEAALNTIASTLTDGVWGDVCFVLRDPNSSHGTYAKVYGNSRLIGQRSLYLRHLIEEAGRSSAQAAVYMLEESEREAIDPKQRFPHEVADSDFGADADRVGDEGQAEDERTRASTPIPGSRFIENQDVLDAISRTGRTNADQTTSQQSNGVRGPNSPASASANSGRNRTLGKFRSRKPKAKHALDDAVDLFNIRLDEVAPSLASSNSTGLLREPSYSNGNGARAGPAPIKYVAIRDAAVTTFKRIIFWLETDQIVFAPLSSSAATSDSGGRAGDAFFADDGRSNASSPNRNGTNSSPVSLSSSRDRFIQQYLQAHPSHPAPASAKSVYRLAETYRIAGLQDLALAHVRSQLRPSNILRELFSPFTLRYPKIREMQLEYALQHWEEIKARYSANLDKILEQSHFTPEAAKLLGRMLSMATMDLKARSKTE